MSSGSETPTSDSATIAGGVVQRRTKDALIDVREAKVSCHQFIEAALNLFSRAARTRQSRQALVIECRNRQRKTSDDPGVMSGKASRSGNRTQPAQRTDPSWS